MSFSSILLAILALSVIIIVHELGHFIVAKCSNIKVNEFSLFFGKMLFQVKKGETVYGIRTIPFGASVRMEGEEEASDDPRSFNNKPAFIKFLVIVAGPIMNFILAIILFIVLFGINGYTTTKINSLVPDSAAYEAGIMEGDTVTKYNGKAVFSAADIDLYAHVTKNETISLTVKRGGEPLTFDISPRRDRFILNFYPYQAEGKTNVVEKVTPDGPADLAGIVAEDTIIRINDTEVADITQIRAALQASGGNPVNVTLLRGGEEVTITGITPKKEMESETTAIGIAEYGYERGNFAGWVKQSFTYSISVGRSVLLSFGWLVTGKVSLSELMGPIGVVSTIGEFVEQSVTVKYKILNLLNLMSMISINLGLFNLFPFPALDGFRALFIILEGIRRKPILTKEREAVINFAGFILLIGVLVLVTFNDIARIFTNVFG